MDPHGNRWKCSRAKHHVLDLVYIRQKLGKTVAAFLYTPGREIATSSRESTPFTCLHLEGWGYMRVDCPVRGSARIIAGWNDQIARRTQSDEKTRRCTLYLPTKVQVRTNVSGTQYSSPPINRLDVLMTAQAHPVDQKSPKTWRKYAPYTCLTRGMMRYGHDQLPPSAGN